MIRTPIRVLYALALGIATGVLADHAIRTENGWLIAMVAVAASAASVQVWYAAEPLLGTSKQRVATTRIIDEFLRTRLLTYFQQGLFKYPTPRHLPDGTEYNDEIMDVAIHVWEVPVWYRRFYSYKIRRWLKKHLSRSTFGKRVVSSLSFRPPLKRVGYQQFNRKPSSDIPFRKGYGLVGDCLLENRENDALIADFRNPILSSLLAQGEEAWESASRGANKTYDAHKLHFDDAVSLAARYSTAAAQVLRNPQSGEPVGVITLSLPPWSTIDLKTSGQILKELDDVRHFAAGIVSNTKTL